MFSSPLTSQALLFLVQKSTTVQNRSSFGGVQKFSGERVLWYVFLPPYVLHPPISRPKRKGFKQIRRPRIFEQKGLFPAFSRFSRCSSNPLEKGDKGRKGLKRPISRKGSQTPLKPPFVTPPFAAAQPSHHICIYIYIYTPLGFGPTFLVSEVFCWHPL